MTVRARTEQESLTVKLITDECALVRESLEPPGEECSEEKEVVI